MPRLPDEVRAAIAADFQSGQSSERAAIAITKAEVREVVDAIDDAYDGFRAAFQTALPPAYAALDPGQQRRLLLAVIEQREPLDG